MIEMQVRRQRDVDGRGGEAGIGERVIEVTLPRERVEVRLLRRHLVPGPAVHEHPAPIGLDEQRAHRQLHTMPIVGRRQLLPERPWNDPEHGPAVEPEPAVMEHRELQVAEGEPFDVEHSAPAPRTVSARPRTP